MTTLQINLTLPLYKRLKKNTIFMYLVQNNLFLAKTQQLILMFQMDFLVLCDIILG